MLNSVQPLGQTQLHSRLGSTSMLRPKNRRGHRATVAGLMLTSLVDAFSILVIFLLMSFSSSGELLTLGKGMELPKATGAQLERNPVVKLENDKIFLGDR